MTIIQGLIASGSSKPAPTIDVMLAPNMTYMNEGQYNAIYINVTNYPNTTLYWKVWNYPGTTNVDWVNNEQPQGTVNVYGDGQFPVQWQAATDQSTDGTKTYGIVLATDPAFSNQIVNFYPLFVNDTSQWTFNGPLTWVWDNTYGTNSTTWDNSTYTGVYNSMNVYTTNSTFLMTMTGTPIRETVTFANSSTGTAYDISSGNYLTTPNMNSNSNWSGSVQGLTIEMWFYATQAGANSGSCLLSEVAPLPTGGSYYANILEINDDGSVSFRVWDYTTNARVTTPNGVTQYGWNHVWAQLDASSGLASIVLNNWNSVSSASGWNWDKAADYGNHIESWNIGHSTSTVHAQDGTTNNRDFVGKIGLVRISNYTLPSNYDQDKIKYTNYPAPVLYLDATDESTIYSNLWHDKSGNGKHAALLNAPEVQLRKGVIFDPNSYQYAATSGVGDLTYWSIDVWFKLTAMPNAGGLTSVITTVYQEGNYPATNQINFSLSNYGRDYNGMGYKGNQFCVSFYNNNDNGEGNGGWHFSGLQTYNIGEWYHVVGTWDGTYIKTYINSSFVDNHYIQNNMTTSANGGGIRIARRWDAPANDSAQFNPVEVGIARVYSTVLSSDQVLANYNEHRIKFGK